MEGLAAKIRREGGRGADICGADLTLADLRGVDLRGARLLDANLRRARLDNANLQDADLTGADFQGASLEGVNLSRAKLSRASFHGANLRRADLQRTDSIGTVDFSHVRLEGACLNEAGLFEAKLDNAKLMNAQLSSTNLRHASLVGANLEGAHMQGAHLDCANLRSAFLKGADMEGADLQFADLSNAFRKRTRLPTPINARYVDLTTASGYVLDGDDISTWRFPAGTAFKLPSWLRVLFHPHGEEATYSDPWSQLRRSYTGVMTAFHAVFALVAFAPYLFRALAGEVAHYAYGFVEAAEGEVDPAAMSRVLVALGADQPDRVLLLTSGVAILAYNSYRVMATWWLSQLREEETRTQRAPRKLQYWRWWLVEYYFMRYLMFVCVTLGLVRTVHWFLQPIRVG